MRRRTGVLVVLVKIYAIWAFCFLPCLLYSQQDDACAGLSCTSKLQISVDRFCDTDIEPRDILNDFDPDVDYQLELYYGDSLIHTPLDPSLLNKTITAKVICGDNSCWSQLAIEAKVEDIPRQPCETRSDGTIPEGCITWCSDQIPDIIVTEQEYLDIRGQYCMRQMTGNILVEREKQGALCDDDGEIIHIRYYGNILTEEGKKKTLLLAQTYQNLKIDLEDTDTNPIVFPKPVELDCNDEFTPADIFEKTGEIELSYPYYIDGHRSKPDSMHVCDTTQIEVGFEIVDRRVLDTIEGEEVWRIYKIKEKIYEDSISCGPAPIYDENGDPVLIPEIVPLNSNFCNIQVTYEDLLIDNCGGGYKIIREWKVYDWCNKGYIDTKRQTIEVKDRTAPEIRSEPVVLYAHQSPWDCSASLDLPVIDVHDDCTDSLLYFYKIEDGELEDGKIVNLWPSEDTMYLEVEVADLCGNASTIVYPVVYKDSNPPTAICLKNVVVSITGEQYGLDGAAKLYADDLNNHSNDGPCGDVDITIVRKDDYSENIRNCHGEHIGFRPKSCYVQKDTISSSYSPNGLGGCSGINTAPSFIEISKEGEYAKFCCEDVGHEIPVVLIATDAAGNKGYCESSIQVRNSFGPHITCRTHVVDCIEDMSRTPKPIIDPGDYCQKLGYIALIDEEHLNDDNCDSIQLSRRWYVDLNLNYQRDEYEPNCVQRVTYVNTNMDIELECKDVEISCETPLDSVDIPNIVEGGFCVCSQNAVKLLSTSDPSNQLCIGSQLQRTYYADLDDDNRLDTNEPTCVQQVTINSSTTADFEIQCRDTTLICADNIDEVGPPSFITLEGCECDDIEVKLESESEVEGECGIEMLFQTFYVDQDLDNIRDPNEAFCERTISVEFDFTSIMLECTNTLVSCNDDINQLPKPEIQNMDCSCSAIDFEVLPFGDVMSDSDMCPGDTLVQMWYVDINRNMEYDTDEPSCDQIIEIYRSPSSFILDCPVVEVQCDSDLSTVGPPTFTVHRGCTCDNATMRLMSEDIPQSNCADTLSIREYYLDINGDNNRTANEPSCNQVIKLEAGALSNALILDCSDQQITCSTDLGQIQAPSVIGSGLCQCSDDFVLELGTAIDPDRDICLGDTILQQWFLDSNRSGVFDDDELQCSQNIVIDSNSTLELFCPPTSANCSQDLEDIPLATLGMNGLCNCEDIEIQSVQNFPDSICFGDTLSRVFYIDSNENGQFDTNESNCTQQIALENTPANDSTLQCEQLMVNCTQDIADLGVSINVQSGDLCNCELDSQVKVSNMDEVTDLCVGDMLTRELYLDVNDNNIVDSDEQTCIQQIVVSDLGIETIDCPERLIECGVMSDQVELPPVPSLDFCECSEATMKLISAESTMDLCPGESANRILYLDLNDNDVQDAGELTCNQTLTINPFGNSTPTLVCDTLTIDCNMGLDSLPLPRLSGDDMCMCTDGSILLVDSMVLSTQCLVDTVRIAYYLDSNGDGTQGTTEPTCSHLVLPEGGAEAAFDPSTIVWPRNHTGSLLRGFELTCDGDNINEENAFLQEKPSMNCMPNISELDRPYWCESECSNITYSVRYDTIPSSIACFTLQARYTLIDWCVYDPTETDTLNQTPDQTRIVLDRTMGDSCQTCERNSTSLDSIYYRMENVVEDGVYVYVQEYLIDDEDPPTLTLMADTVRIEIPISQCTADTTVSAMAMDVCDGTMTDPSMIQWTVRVVDQNREPVPDENGDVFENFVGTEATMNSRKGSPGDVYSIIWTVRDGCNTASIQETVVIFEYARGERLRCASMDSIPMNEDQLVILDAYQFIQDFDTLCLMTDSIFTTAVPSGTSPAAPGDSLFDGQTRVEFDCDNFRDITSLDVYLWQGSRAVGSCIANVNVIDDEEYCGTGIAIDTKDDMLRGKIETSKGAYIPGVEVAINGRSTDMYAMTDRDGYYAFDHLPTDPYYKIEANKEHRYSNEVSVLDILLVQRHLLGISDLENAFQLLAGDVNNDEKLSSLDIVDMKKLILEVKDEFQSENWLFLSKKQNFYNEMDPWPVEFGLTKYGTGTEKDPIEEDFIGLLLGDVNDTYGSDIIGIREPLVVSKHKLENKIRYHFNRDIHAVQAHWTLTSKDKIKEIRINGELLENDDYSLLDSQLKIATTNPYKTIQTLELTFESNPDEQVRLDNSESYFEAVDAIGGVYRDYILINEEHQSIEKTLLSTSIYPNPFQNSFHIKVENVSDEEVLDIRISTIEGKVVLEQSEMLISGNNIFSFDANRLPYTGTYIVQLIVNSQSEYFRVIRH